jgi:pyruvyltransferase
VGNFGDLLGPPIVERMAESSGRDVDHAVGSGRLFSVGSVLHFAASGDHVWGAGVNGKVERSAYVFEDLKVHAVRGPLTREFLLDRNIDCPKVFGDPALLLPSLFPELIPPNSAKLAGGTLIIPNLNDFDDWVSSGIPVVDPRSPWRRLVARIAASSFVLGSSLHAIIVADAFGVPARLVSSRHESPFKYEDYYLGSGRDSYTAASTVRRAEEMGGESMLNWKGDKLSEAFPASLWLGIHD